MRTSQTVSRMLLLAMVGAAALGCAGQGQRFNPFAVPKSQLTGIRTIAVTPIWAADEVGDVDPGRGRFDSLLVAELEAAGLVVVPAEESAAVWKRVTDSLGGLFDPGSGQVDSVKFNQARTLAMAELSERFHADAWLHPAIVIAPAKFDAGTAKWDGTSQSYQSTGKKLLAALFGAETYGRAPALSVLVTIEDMRGQDLYTNQGGLQLFEIPKGQEFVRVPARELYANPLRNAQAVRLALAPFVATAKELRGTR